MTCIYVKVPVIKSAASTRGAGTKVHSPTFAIPEDALEGERQTFAVGPLILYLSSPRLAGRPFSLLFNFQALLNHLFPLDSEAILPP